MYMLSLSQTPDSSWPSLLSSRAARVAHEKQLGALHAAWVVVAMGDHIAGVGQAQAEGEQLRRALEPSKPWQARHLRLEVHLDRNLAGCRTVVCNQLRQDRPFIAFDVHLEECRSRVDAGEPKCMSVAHKRQLARRVDKAPCRPVIDPPFALASGRWPNTMVVQAHAPTQVHGHCNLLRVDGAVKYLNSAPGASDDVLFKCPLSVATQRHHNARVAALKPACHLRLRVTDGTTAALGAKYLQSQARRANRAEQIKPCVANSNR
mmetsp:Transcript_12183/g.24783  ORF Transcript_12183/g.24783 Transcript_12183/m.24783 type:complete len:263 (-) Transcript_12183:150-938(-)